VDLTRLKIIFNLVISSFHDQSVYPAVNSGEQYSRRYDLLILLFSFSRLTAYYCTGSALSVNSKGVPLRPTTVKRWIKPTRRTRVIWRRIRPVWMNNSRQDYGSSTGDQFTWLWSTLKSWHDTHWHWLQNKISLRKWWENLTWSTW
jgi:hypothetical protein